MKTTTAAKFINVLPKSFVRFASRAVLNGYLRKYANIVIEGEENLDRAQTPTLFVCNHLSNADGLILPNVLKKIDPTFVAGVKLSKDSVTNLGMNIVKTTTIIPNTADKEGIKRIIDLVNSGESILIFPEGTRSRTGSLIEAKKGIILIARMTKVPVVPIGIWGTEQLLPIDRSGDMAAENFSYADVHIRIGEQFDFPKRIKGQDKKEYEEASVTSVMKKIAELLPDEYRGVYK